VSGIRVTQSFVRQNFNSRLFLGQVVDHFQLPHGGSSAVGRAAATSWN
jgi:hypothetical protein